MSPKFRITPCPQPVRQAVESYPAWFGLPLITPEQCIGFFILGSHSAQDYAPEDLRFFQALFAQISGYIHQLVMREAEIKLLRQKVTDRPSYGEIIGQCAKMQEVYELIDLVVRLRRHCFYHRRERHRQGTGGPGHPRTQPPA